MGVDFGVTSAFAVVDANGELLRVESERNCKQSDFLSRVSDFSPAIIASDTNPPVKQARKLAASLRARVYAPPHSLTLIEKAFLARRDSPHNSHERDAIAAARKAWHASENKLRKLDKKLRCAGLEEKRGEASRRVLRGTRIATIVKK